MPRFVAPAGAPIQVSQVIQAALRTMFPVQEEENTIEFLAGALNARHLFGVCSGRAALTLILKALHRLRPNRDVVVLPAYTCYTVAGAVVRAGLKIHPVDIDQATLDFSPPQLAAIPRDRVLCLLTSNLFGLVNDPQPVRAAADACGAFVVDDAAQALGASRGGSAAGQQGDAGFYSLGRGKALAAMEGGLIVTNSDEIAAAIEAETTDISAPGLLHSAGLFLKLLGYALFLRPQLFWIPNSMPFMKFGSTEFDTQFPCRRLPNLVWNLLPDLLRGLEKLNRIRRENAAEYASLLAGHPCLAAPSVPNGCSPNYIRYPVLARDQAVRERAVRALRAAGIGATPFYPGAICDIEGINGHMAAFDSHCPQAEAAAHRLFTLPTHPYLSREDLQTVSRALRQVAAA